MASSTHGKPAAPLPQPNRIVFDKFVVDVRSGQLWKDGKRIRLQAQPFQLLVLLMKNAGEVVTRDEVCRELWPTNTFVDFEHGVAAALNKVRDALDDSASQPQYIETIPKRGYRFIGTMQPERPVALPGLEPVVAVVPLPKKNRPWRTLGVIALLAAATVAVAWLPLRQRGQIAEAMTVAPFTPYPGRETAPAMSPDGSRIAFAWAKKLNSRTKQPDYDLYVKAIGSETILQLTNHPAEWISSAWSPDGTQIAFHRLAADDNGIYVVPAMGGPERRLIATHTPYNLAAPLSWSPDGKWIAYADTEDGKPGDRVFLLNAATGESHAFPHDPSCMHEGDLKFSHGGEQLAILCVHTTTWFEYFVTDLEGKSKRSLLTSHLFPTDIAWNGDDTALIVTNEKPGGAELIELSVSDGTVRKLPLPAGRWPTISQDGRKLAFNAEESRTNIRRKDLRNPEAPAEEMYPSKLNQNAAEYSPDGKHVAFDSARSGIWSIWVADADGSNLTQITHDAPAGFPRWSPDSKEIAFVVIDGSNGEEGVYTANLTERLPRKLKMNIRQASRPFWSPDGKWIYFEGSEGVEHQIYRCPAEGGEAKLVLSQTSPPIRVESFDDGTLYYPWISGNTTLLMRFAPDTPGAKPQALPGMPSIFDPAQWTLAPGGIYFTPLDAPRVVSFYDFATQKIHTVFENKRDLAENLSLSPDGRYLLYSEIEASDSTIMLVEHFR